ncbi:MAG TPA: LapA family protein [Thermodesulfobacteriota bacterium]|nr:LapA family protein [Thermodesulfobacteriota bacterium]
MTRPKIIIALILAVLIAIVLAQNSEAVNVNLFFWEFSASAFIMYLIFFVIGALSAIIGLFWRRI